MSEQVESDVLVRQLEAEAFRLGFCLFGVTDCSPTSTVPFYEQWLADGLNAGMSYLESERHRILRRNPEKLFPGARSIIMLAWPYPLTYPGEDPQAGWIAGYACQPDYHESLIPLMQSLSAEISRLIGKELTAGYFTDSAPVLERELGQRAGLGWIGKNSCLISTTAGSAFLLSEIFLPVALPASLPFAADRCGTCHRCVDACPTHCILPNRTIDAGKCISYLTIENKGGIPLPLRDQVSQWAFGCDICQTVCPWNKKPQKALQPVDRRNKLSLQEMIHDLALSEGEFKAKYRHTPILRAKQRGFLRNLAVVMANTRQAAAAEALRKILEHDINQPLRELFTWALSKLVHEGSTEENTSQ